MGIKRCSKSGIHKNSHKLGIEEVIGGKVLCLMATTSLCENSLTKSRRKGQDLVFVASLRQQPRYHSQQSGYMFISIFTIVCITTSSGISLEQAPQSSGNYLFSRLINFNTKLPTYIIYISQANQI